MRLEQELDEGWVADDGTVCDWDWFNMNMLRASRTREVPDKDGRGVVAVGCRCWCQGHRDGRHTVRGLVIRAEKATFR